METRSGSVCDYAFPVSVQSKHCFLLFFFFFSWPHPSPQELAISLTAFVPYGKVIVEPRGRNASLERMDFILRYFRWLFIYVVSYCCSRQRSVAEARVSACVCVRVCVHRSQPAFPFVSICSGKYSTLALQRAEQAEFASLFIFLHRDPTLLLMASCLRYSPSIAILLLFMAGQR